MVSVVFSIVLVFVFVSLKVSRFSVIVVRLVFISVMICVRKRW